MSSMHRGTERVEQKFAVERIYWYYPIKVQYYRDIIISSWLVWKSWRLLQLLSFAYTRILWPRIVIRNLVFHNRISTGLCLENYCCHGKSEWTILFFKTWLPPKGTVLVYVKMLYVLLMGEIKFSLYDFLFNFSHGIYILTNFISQVEDHTCILVLKQPSFVMLPVHANSHGLMTKGYK